MKNNRLLPFVFLLFLFSYSFGMKTKTISFSDTLEKKWYKRVILKYDIASGIFFKFQRSFQYFPYPNNIKGKTFSLEYLVNKRHALLLTFMHYRQGIDLKYFTNEYLAPNIPDETLSQNTNINTIVIIPEYKRYLSVSGLYASAYLKLKLEQFGQRSIYLDHIWELKYIDNYIGTGLSIGYLKPFWKYLIIEPQFGIGTLYFAKRNFKIDNRNDNPIWQNKFIMDYRFMLNLGIKF